MTKYLERPFHIGKIEVRPGRGEYVLRDVVIDGYAPGDRPHFEAKTIIVKTSYRTLLERQLFIEVALHDWTMRIERWSDHHNIPRYQPRDRTEKKEKGPITFRISARAFGGTFTYEDHTTPWSVVAPNLNFAMDWAAPEKRYAGTANFFGGTVAIQNYLPMSTDMKTRFFLEGSKVTLPHIDLKTDGAVTHVTGNLDFSRWPEQSYVVKSDIDFARMKAIFFAKETWVVRGRGQFAGVFNLYKDGRDLSGDFSSDLATVGDLRFPNLHGSLVWLPNRFAVTHAEADFYGGDTRFAYAVEPLGTPTGSTQKFTADFEGVDLKQLDGIGIKLKGIELAGRARGRVGMAWPSGHLKQGVFGQGELSAVPPDGVTLATANLPARLSYERVGAPARVPRAKNAPWPALGPLPVGGALEFRFDPEGVTFRESRIATPTTFVSLQGRTMYGGEADFPFHVTSHDWQASDRLLAAIISAATGSTSTPVEVGGIGTFDGRMTGSFKAPRVEGCFSGDEMYAWGVTWGRGEGDVVIENKYLDLTDGIIARGDGTIKASGRFALGFPRADGGEDIRAKVSMKSWPLGDLSLAFGKTDWPIHGLVAESELDLYGKYDNALFGKGPLKIVNGEAWKETFESASADLAFNGPTVDITNILVTKGSGVLKGTASLGWNSTYSFEVTGERIAVESLDNFKLERVPLTGVMSINPCTGDGTFEKPYYRCYAEVPDLSVGDQVIGQTRAEIFVRDGMLTINRIVALSNRLDVFVSGQVQLAEPYQSTFNAEFKDTSIDPYMKFLVPEKRWSDLIHAVVFGTASASGPLRDFGKMAFKASISQGRLSLYDYELRNEGPIEFTVKEGKLDLGRARLTGTDTDVEITGGYANNAADFTLNGKVNLKILQSPGVVTVSSGTATLNATVKGSLESPKLAGTATFEKGEFRWGTLPRLTDISGQATFDETEINADGLTAKVGNGNVVFGGNMTLDLNEFRNSAYHLTAAGRDMVLRYPEGFQSKVDADLTLTGPVMSPVLRGDVTVLSASYTRRFDTDAAAILGLAGGGQPDLESAVSPDEGVRLTTDIHITAPRSSLLIDNGSGTHIEGSGSLEYRAEGERSSLTGYIDLDRADVTWNANKFVIQSGKIRFDNPSRIEPNFDVAATVRPHAPGQTFDVGIRINGTASKLSLNLSSDPWLPEADIIRLLLGEAPDVQRAAEVRSLSSSQDAAQLASMAAAQLLLSPLSSRVGTVLGDIPGAPTIFISPVFGNDIVTTATARVIVGKQLSSKAYISYARTLSPMTEFILLEYEQNERLSWILSRNEDRTFAFDFRIRHVF